MAEKKNKLYCSTYDLYTLFLPVFYQNSRAVLCCHPPFLLRRSSWRHSIWFPVDSNICNSCQKKLIRISQPQPLRYSVLLTLPTRTARSYERRHWVVNSVVDAYSLPPSCVVVFHIKPTDILVIVTDCVQVRCRHLTGQLTTLPRPHCE